MSKLTQFHALVAILACASLAWATSAQAIIITDVTNPGDFIIGIDLDGGSGSPGAESPPNAIDNTSATKYLNFGGTNSGLIVTPSNNPINVAVTSLTLTTANDSPVRDPGSFILYGTNDPITSLPNSTGTAETWTLIYSAPLSPPAARFTDYPTVSFDNQIHYTSFRLVFPTLNPSGDPNMQFSELQLGAQTITVPEPATFALLGLGAFGLAIKARRRRTAV